MEDESITEEGPPATLPLQCTAGTAADADAVHPRQPDNALAKQAGALTPQFGRLAEKPLEPLTPTPSRVMNTRTLPTVSQSPSPAPVRWREDVCRSSSAPPQVGTTDTDHALQNAPRMPSRPKSCSADLPNQPAPILLCFAPRDSRRSESPATSPVSTTPESGHPAHGPEYTGEPSNQLPAVEGLTIEPAQSDEVGPVDCESAGDPQSSTSTESTSEQPMSPHRSQSKWWQSGPSPYRHRPLTLVNTTKSSDLITAQPPERKLEQHHLTPVEDDEELSELDSASEAEASEVASTPYMSAVSTPADSSTSLPDALSPSRPVPILKPKSKGNARQLLDLQTYSTSILGGQTVMSAKRTRQRDSSETVGSTTVLC